MELLASASIPRLILAYLEELGLNEQKLGLPSLAPAIRKSNEPMQVSARIGVDLLERAALVLNEPNIGLRYAQWMNLRGLDSLSLLWDHVSSLDEWFTLAQRFIHLENNALGYERRQDYPDETALLHNVVSILRPVATQFTFAFIALTVRVFRTRMGERWAPIRATFTCGEPLDTGELRAFFRCAMDFESDHNALIVAPEELSQRLTPHDPELVRFLVANLSRQRDHQDGPITENVRRAIATNLHGRAPTLGEIAVLLQMAPRTLQRRLSAAQTSYQAILDDVRRQILREHEETGQQRGLAQLAHALGFSDGSAARRFIRTKHRIG